MGASTPSTTQSAASGSSCHVTYVDQNDWGSGFTGNVSITNQGSAAINGWTLTWTWSGNQQLSGALECQSDAKRTEGDLHKRELEWIDRSGSHAHRNRVQCQLQRIEFNSACILFERCVVPVTGSVWRTHSSCAASPFLATHCLFGEALRMEPSCRHER
jgi:hypothetical protein